MIREATIEDAAAIARIHVETWQHAYRDILPESFLNRLSVPRRLAFWETCIAGNPGAVLVFEEQGDVSGWINFGPCRDEGDQEDGEVYAVYVAPDRWSTGIGRTLMAAALQVLANKGYGSIHLWVLEENHRTIRFYEGLGFSDDARRKPITIEGGEFVEIRMTRPRAENV